MGWIKDPEKRKAYYKRKRQRFKKRWREDPEFRARTREYRRCYFKKKYASDPEFRRILRESTKAWRERNPEKHREHRRIHLEREHWKYHNDPQYRKKKLDHLARRRREDPVWYRKCIDSKQKWYYSPRGRQKMAEWRRKNVKRRVAHSRAWDKRNPERTRAGVIARRACKMGILKKQPCFICGSRKKVEKHHDDYSKPLDVTWLCRPCHRLLDRRPKTLIEKALDKSE